MFDINTRPCAEKFSRDNQHLWHEYVYNLALRSLPVRDIAAKLRCNPQYLQSTPEILEIIKDGHAQHRLVIEHELFCDAITSPMDYEMEERGAIRAARASALKILKQAIEKKEEFLKAPLENERVRRLTDEELQAELKKHVQAS